MGAKSDRLKIDGWVNLAKPAQLGSTQALARAKRVLNAHKAGHAGTLDPFATGVLPLAFGAATRLVGYQMDGQKEYEFSLRFGAITDTLDLEGQITQTSDAPAPTAEQISAVLGGFIGDIQQMPPIYSALKIKGKRAYDLARQGQEVALAPRSVQIYALSFLGFDKAGDACFHVGCGKGTYVRALGRDIAAKLGTIGYLTSLKRTRVGRFLLKDAISLEKLEALGHKAALAEALQAVDSVLDDTLAYDLTATQLADLQQGRPCLCPLKGQADMVIARFQGKAMTLCKLDDGRLIPVRQLVSS